MSDSPLDVVGIFDPQRQRRLLTGLATRVARTHNELGKLQSRLADEEVVETEQLDLRRHETVDHCREQRREMLDRWDDAEERLTTEYEANTVKLTQELTRLTTLFRRKLAEEKKTIERKVNARHGAVNQQYENRRNAPGQQMRKEIALIDEALDPVSANLEEVRALTIRRLDYLPEVPPPQNEDEDVAEPTPATVRDCVDAIGRLQRRSRDTVDEMKTGAASKIVDSFYLPAGVALFVTLWFATVLVIRPENYFWGWLGAGVLVAGVLGFAVYGVLLLPLRKMTRRLYPHAERLLAAAEQCADVGRKLAKKTAHETSTELMERRDAHLAAADRWHTEQNTEVEKNLAAEQAAAKQHLEVSIQDTAKLFTREFNKVGTQMRGDADSLAQSITQTISQTDLNNKAKRDELAARRVAELRHAEYRLRDGIIRGLQRMDLACERVEDRYPSWETIANAAVSAAQVTPCLPVGRLLVTENLRHALANSNANQPSGSPSNSLFGAELPEALPVVLHRRLQTGLIINAVPTQLDQGIDLAQAILWRLLCGVAPGRAKLTLIDPIGRGQNFASFMSMTDHQADIVGHRVWSGERQIEERLAELSHHAEDILQVNLRDRFQRIEQYNAIAGSMFEPYRAIAAIGFPESLTRGSYKHLRAIIDSSIRCGVFTILVCDHSRPWPGDMPMPTDRRLLRLNIDEEGRWRVDDPELSDIAFQPITSPPANMRATLINRIGAAAISAAKVEIPFDSIAASTVSIASGPIATLPTLPEPDCCDDQLAIPIGVQGARRLQSLRLGEGVKQHVLIAGKTGSGKSSLLHTIITAGAARYRPDQLHYYLLDFKKGVEFKVYADAALPHARVIGIESEREFGRSVLQRLDADLQTRGEQFRDAGVQELSEYRRRTGKEMPRVLLVVDEFQEIFSRDDRLASDCTVLLDRLVRQGRSFGMHVILSSQSLAGAQSLPRATLGQMAVRVALQCSESDAVLILSDDNTAARLISRPGEAIYNDAGGLLEGNQPFQVAYLTTDRQIAWLEQIAARDAEATSTLPPRVVFEGTRPCRWNADLASAGFVSRKAGTLTALLGEAVELGPPTTLVLSRESGRNVLVVAPNEMTGGLLGTFLSGLAAPLADGTHATILYFDGGRSDDLLLGQWLHDSGVPCEIIKPRDSEARLAKVAELIQQRIDAEDHQQSPLVLVVDPLERFRDFRQDESFNFSLDAAARTNGAESLQRVLRDGPSVGVYTVLVCGSAETLSRWLPRASRHDLQQRILGRINPADSSALIDSPDASNLSAATMLIYDDVDGSQRKFRACDLPAAESVRAWLEQRTPA